jgi:hypothetical protein
MLYHDARSEVSAQLSCFRSEFHSCLTARSDALLELTDAVRCSDGPVRSPAQPSLAGEGLLAGGAFGGDHFVDPPLLRGEGLGAGDLGNPVMLTGLPGSSSRPVKAGHQTVRAAALAWTWAT